MEAFFLKNAQIARIKQLVHPTYWLRRKQGANGTPRRHEQRRTGVEMKGEKPVQQPRYKATPVLSAFGVGKRFPAASGEMWAVRDCFLEVERSSFVCIWGPPGSGKTTLLSLLAGLERPDEGEVYLDGMQLDRASGRELLDLRRRKLGFLLHSSHLQPDLSVLENIALPLLLSGHPGDALVLARGAAERFGLGLRLKHYPAELPRLDRLKVAFARALVIDPLLVVSDEPTANLDRETAAAALDMLCDAAGQGYTVLVASRDERVAQAADQVIELGSA